jgi:hypothetical protein
MPSIATEQKQFYKAKNRSLIAIDHGISRLEIQQRLDKEGLHLDRHYVGKLYDEIRVERTKRMDRRMLNAALSSFRRHHDGGGQAGVVNRNHSLQQRSSYRLQVVAPYIKNGTVLFPRSGCEQLLRQIFNLGVESHDDGCDALVWLIQGFVEQGLELPKIHWIEA